MTELDIRRVVGEFKEEAMRIGGEYIVSDLEFEALERKEEEIIRLIMNNAGKPA